MNENPPSTFSAMSNNDNPIFNDQDVKKENSNREVFYFTAPSSDIHFDPAVGSYQVANTEAGMSSADQSSSFAMPFTDNQLNQFLVSDCGEEEAKLPINIANLLKMNGLMEVKGEINSGIPHFVKYKPDKNGKKVKIWECGICRKEFGHQYILMRHLPTHTDERKFSCKQCGKAFRQMSTLSQHRAIHSKLRPYICEVCQKTFNRVSTLISHRKTHTGLKPHRCHLCNKAFHQKGNLRNHIFTHTNERPYKCDVCQKGFNQMSNLMCHKFKSHQRDDKPKYNCQVCSKEFDKRMTLRNHEQYEHGEGTVLSISSANAPSASSSNAPMAKPPSVKYTNGVLVAPINTAAMKDAIATNQVPFALLKPLVGIPVLVRVFPAGEKQMLVPATIEDLKKFGELNVKKEKNDEEQNEPEVKEAAEKLKKATVQIKIPVVATVIQRRKDGTLYMDVENPGPNEMVHNVSETDIDSMPINCDQDHPVIDLQRDDGVANKEAIKIEKGANKRNVHTLSDKKECGPSDDAVNFSEMGKEKVIKVISEKVDRESLFQEVHPVIDIADEDGDVDAVEVINVETNKVEADEICVD